MELLRQAYRRLANIVGNDIESLESVELVEAYRRSFKPEKVRVVLLAESHVFTDDADRRIVIPPIPELPGYRPLKMRLDQSDI